ncbi:1752_t:CDS:1, partial [Gigaspora margarita]
EQKSSKEILAEIQDRFRFIISLPKSYISINPTDKLELLQDTSDNK